MVYKTIIHIIWSITPHASLSICFFNWRQQSQIMVVSIRGTLYVAVALYSTVKDKKVKFQTKYEKTESNYLFLFSLLTLLLLTITLSSFHSVRWEIWTVNVNATMQQKTYITLSENANKTAKNSLDHSCVKALFTEACR